MTFDSRWKNPQGSTPEQLHLWAQDLIRELRKGEHLPDAVTTLAATAITYSNATSGLTATNVQAAIDEIEARVDILEAAPDPGLVLLNSGTVTNQATLDIVLTTFTAYRGFHIVLMNFLPASDDVELWARLSTDGGANYDAGASDYRWTTHRDLESGAAPEADAADDAILIAGSTAAGAAVSNVAAEGGCSAVFVDLLNQTDTAIRPGLFYRSAWFTATTAITGWLGGNGQRVTAQDTNAIRFLFETGNITSGNWALYGYA